MSAEAKPATTRTAMHVDRLMARLKAVERERDALQAECDRLVHQVICCGVAASHTNAGLTLTGAYAAEWDSIQAKQVRELRAERDALRSANDSFATASILPDDKAIVDAAEFEALRADAERYRWLTDDHGIHEARLDVFRVSESIPIRGKGATDAAIDSARGQE